MTGEGDLNATWEPECGESESESDAIVGVIPRSYLEEVNTIKLTECRHYIHYIHSALLYWIHQKPVIGCGGPNLLLSYIYSLSVSGKRILVKILFVNENNLL